MSRAIIALGAVALLLAACDREERKLSHESTPASLTPQTRQVGELQPGAQGAGLTEILERGGTAADVDERIDELEETMRLTSICGLGQVALGPVMSVLRMQRDRA